MMVKLILDLTISSSPSMTVMERSNGQNSLVQVETMFFLAQLVVEGVNQVLQFPQLMKYISLVSLMGTLTAVG